ncbi:pachytene checkpoint protein 2 homolog [Euwallacea fornicatus]|uniref:pachytene checkpoint protein 2 homolog n=1 Tax=Euwallacea fornicatus TaxID=995702 RepID=UPI0033906F26
MKINRAIDIEIVFKCHSPVSENSIIAIVQNYLNDQKVKPNTVISEFNSELEGFSSLIEAIVIGEALNESQNSILDLKTFKVSWYLYCLDLDGASTQTETDENGGEIALASHLTLPCKELFTLWENLYYEDNIKQNLLKYAKTMMEFSRKGINPNILSCNRVILLHGPPGTGKTSLCKALAQKLSVRMKDKYSSSVLIEINSHSLFSKWFSESGKLVNKMFSKIKEICENESLLVCLLMDEVESLAHARDQCISGNEPSDAVRVVNAMLTQIDQIKRFPNVLILATSNMTQAIDLAFVDRADIKQYLGMPSVPAIYRIYYSCLIELIQKKVIKADAALVDIPDVIECSNESSDYMHECSKKLIEICQKSTDLSGRTLRKIPFLAHALFVRTPDQVYMSEFLDAMEKAVEKEHEQRKSFAERSK